MICTLTLNPAIDLALATEHFVVGGTNRCSVDALDPGGKGINASRVIYRLGRQTVAYAFAGGEMGNLLRRFLDAESVPYEFEALEEMTRIDVIVYVRASGQRSRLLLPGASIGAEHLARMHRKLEQIPSGSTLVLGGSVPPGLPPEIYADLIERYSARGLRIVLDTSGEPLARALEAGPLLVKPNVEEAAEILGCSLTTQADVIRAAFELQRRGARSVVISQGADGAIGVDSSGLFKVAPPAIQARSTVGSGDSMVAGMAIALDEDLGFEAGLRLGTAAGAATASIPGTQLCSAELVAELKPRVRVTPLVPASF